MATSCQPKRVLAASMVGYGSVALQTVLMLALTPFVIRHIGTEAFGVWAVINGLLAFATLLEAPSALAAIKYISRSHDSETPGASNRLVSNLLAAQLSLTGLLTAAVAVITLAFPNLLSPDAPHRATAQLIWIITGGAIAINFPIGLAKSLLVGMGRQVEVQVFGIVGAVLNAVSVFCSLAGGGGLLSLAVASAGSLLFPGLVAWLRVTRLVPGLRVSPRLCSRELLGELLGFGGASFVTNVAMTVVRRVDVLIMAGPLGLTATAVFQIALRIADQAQMFLCQLANALTPAMGELFGSNDRERRAAWFVRGSLASLALAAVPGLFLLVDAERLLLWWVGPDFVAAAAPLRILAVSLLVGCLEDHVGNVLAMGGRHRALAICWIVIAATKILASVLLIPYLGIAAPAAGTLIGSIIGKVLMEMPIGLRLMRVAVARYVRAVIVPVIPAAVAAVLVLAAMPTGGTRPALWQLVVRLAAASLAFAVTFAATGLPADWRRSLAERIRRVVRVPRQGGERVALN